MIYFCVIAILIDVDFSEIYNFHLNNNNDITVVASTKDYEIPYGICHINKKGNLKKLRKNLRANYLLILDYIF